MDTINNDKRGIFLDDFRLQDFKKFVGYLIEAGSKMGRHYFQLAVAGKENPIFRERVYCYELYHQLRCIMERTFPYELDGEVDKAGHPIIRKAKKPDFIVHAPGNMERNLAVIEVKDIKVNERLEDLRKDLNTLKYFLKKAAYYYGIVLVYGDGWNPIPVPIVQEVKGFLKKYNLSIMLMWHRGPNEKLEILLDNFMRKEI